MKESRNPIVSRFNSWDRHRLANALERVWEARFFRRIQAVLLASRGQKPRGIAQITGLSRRAVYYLLERYLHRHRVEDLAERPHPGRPLGAAGLTKARMLRELRRSPLKLGYRTNVWTVATLADRLRERYGILPLSPGPCGGG